MMQPAADVWAFSCNRYFKGDLPTQRTTHTDTLQAHTV